MLLSANESESRVEESEKKTQIVLAILSVSSPKPALSLFLWDKRSTRDEIQFHFKYTLSISVMVHVNQPIPAEFT